MGTGNSAFLNNGDNDDEDGLESEEEGRHVRGKLTAALCPLGAPDVVW